MEPEQDQKVPELKENPRIKWNNLNFPPLLRLVHFDLKELSGITRKACLLLYIQFLIIFGIECLNFLSSIIQAGAKVTHANKVYSKLNILFAFLNILIFTTITALITYAGYITMVRRPTDLRNVIKYRIGQICMCILFFLVSIIRGGSFDGWARMYILKTATPKGAAGFCIFLSRFQNLGYYTAIGCAIYVMSASEKAILEDVENPQINNGMQMENRA